MLYANFDFAGRVGTSLYELIGTKLPLEALFAELVFSNLLGRTSTSLEDLDSARRSAHGHRTRRHGDIPAWLWGLLPRLRDLADEYVDDLVAELLTRPTSIYAFNCMFQLVPCLVVSRELKRRDPSAVVVLGGAACEGDMGAAIHEEFDWIDYVSRGEGEGIIAELLGVVGGSCSPDSIPGLLWRGSAGRSIQNPGRAVFEGSPDALPLPDYDDWFTQLGASGLEVDSRDMVLPLETSRGCWYGERSHCTFCGLTGDSLRFRSKSPDRVVREVEHLERYGVRTVACVDLIMDHGYYSNLLHKLAARRSPLSLFYEVKANIKKDQLELLDAAGVHSIQPGIESLSTPVLRLMRKGVNACQNLRLLKWCAEIGISTEWNILYGFPGEAQEDYDEMTRLVPFLTHLRPPSIGCYRVRLDRFSPLHFDASALGVEKYWPSRAYRLVYGDDQDFLGRIAYHFEFEPVGGAAARVDIHSLEQAVNRWQGSVGKAVFASLNVGGRMWLFDTREVASIPSTVLEEEERAVYRACDAGRTAEGIVSETGIAPDRVAKLLEKHVAQGWTLHVDGRYLSLSVALDRVVDPTVPQPILGAYCRAVAGKRMLDLWSGIDRFHRIPRHEELVSELFAERRGRSAGPGLE